VSIRLVSFRLIQWQFFFETVLELVVVVLRKGLCGRLVEFRFVLVLEGFVEREFGRLQCGSLHKVKGVVPGQLASQPKEGLFEVVVGLGRDVVVLQVLLAVEGDLLGLHLAILDLDLVSGEDDRDVFADPSQVTMPVGNVLVRDPGGDIEHDDGTLALDVVAVTETSEFLRSERERIISQEVAVSDDRHEAKHRSHDAWRITTFGAIPFSPLARQCPRH
jgi:hypothetical protein